MARRHNRHEPDDRRPIGDDEESYPWDVDPDAQDPPGTRHDAFTAKRKAVFLTALMKTGCIEDACRRTGVGRRTVYRHQESDAAFAQHCRLALRMVAVPLELTAWERAVDGWEQEFVVAGEVRVRRRYDAGLLRLLLIGSNPKKYGPRPGFKRKQLVKAERKRIEREVRDEIRVREADTNWEEIDNALLKGFKALGHRMKAQQGEGTAQVPGRLVAFAATPPQDGRTWPGGTVAGEGGPPHSM